MVERARRGELLRLTLGEDRWALVERMQAAMSLIEGHAEHTMDAIGAEVLPSLPRLRAAMNHRREHRGLPWRVLERLLGLELKMRQYELGRRFCDAVVDAGGPQALALRGAAPRRCRPRPSSSSRRCGSRAWPVQARLQAPLRREASANTGRTHVPPVTKSIPRSHPAVTGFSPGARMRAVTISCSGGTNRCSAAEDSGQRTKESQLPSSQPARKRQETPPMPTATNFSDHSDRNARAKAATQSGLGETREPAAAARTKIAERRSAKRAARAPSTRRESAVSQAQTATRETAGVFGDYAERAVLIPVGAALIARDRVVDERQRHALHLLLDDQDTGAAAPLRAPRRDRPQPPRARGPQSARARRARTAPAPPRIESTVSELEERRDASRRAAATSPTACPSWPTEVQERILSLV